jgi:hypothetical protein
VRPRRALHGPVSQNSTANIFVEVNVDLGEPDHGRKGSSIDEPGSHQW